MLLLKNPRCFVNDKSYLLWKKNSNLATVWKVTSKARGGGSLWWREGSLLRRMIKVRVSCGVCIMMFDCLARNAPPPLKNVMLMPKLRAYWTKNCNNLGRNTPRCWLFIVSIPLIPFHIVDSDSTSPTKSLKLSQASFEYIWHLNGINRKLETLTSSLINNSGLPKI